MWGADERIETTKDILCRVARTMPDDIPEDKWRSVVMWVALLQYPSVLELLKMTAELKELAPSESLWVEMVQKYMSKSAICDDLPSFETLSRGLREVQSRYWIKNDPYKYEALAKTI